MLRSSLGKARGQVLRLALVIEFLWWAGVDSADEPPRTISVKAVAAAIELVGNYFIPMARRVYGDAETLGLERNAAAIAGWIIETGATEVHIRHMQRKVRLPGLRLAEDIRAALDFLVDSDWLVAPPRGGQQGRPRVAYKVNPLVHASPAVPPNGHDPEPGPSPADETPFDCEAPAQAGSKARFTRGAPIPEPSPVESKAAVNGGVDTVAPKSRLSAMEQDIVRYDQAHPGLPIAAICKTFGQPKSVVATLLGRQE